MVHGLEETFETVAKSEEQIRKEERRRSWKDVCTQEMVQEAGLSESEAKGMVEGLQGVVEEAFSGEVTTAGGR